MFINTMGNTKSNTAIITEDWVDVDIDDTASEYDSEEEEDMECDGKLIRSLLCVIGTFVYACIIIIQFMLMSTKAHPIQMHSFISSFSAVSFSQRR